MKRTVFTLLLVLAIQCAMVAVVYWPRLTGPAQEALEPLAAFASASIDEIYVGDEYDNETMLRKTGDRWTLPELENLPADNAMVDRLLAAITSSDTDWPIADSTAARQRFQVASYYYQRRIRLLQNYAVLGSYFLGTSPGFRKIHIRNESQDAIYSIAFNAFDAPGHGGGWLDRKLLQVRTPLRITADTYSLHRQGSDWQSGIGLRPDERELEALLTSLRSLQVDGIANPDQQRDLAEAEAALVLEVESLTGTVTLELFTLADRYFVHSSEYALSFTISAYDYERLLNIDFRLISGELKRQ